MKKLMANCHCSLLFLSVIFALLTLASSSDPLYTITAPNSFRPNVPYQLVITIHQAPSPVDVKVSLGPLENNETEPVRNEATIQSGESKLIELNVGSWAPGMYILNLEGSGGLTFNKSASVNYNSKTFSIFIQTDKAIYKPGQKVNFRVVATDVALKPFGKSQATIYVSDAQRNRIKQWQNVTFSHGVFTGDLQLSDQVVLGDWLILVEVERTSQSSTFTVAEYVLPTFEVEVQPPPFATYNDSSVVITVHARYTYGKPIKGKVLVNVSDYYCKWPCQPYNMKPFTVTTSLDGKADVTVDLVKDLALPDWMRHDRRLEIFASVTEGLTGRVQNGTGDITIYESKYKLQFSDGGNFKPGLNYSVTLQVSLQDGSPVLDDDTIVINYFYSWNSPVKNLSFAIPQNGEINFEIVPPDYADNLRFETSYKGARATSYVSKAQSLSERYLQVTLLSQNQTIGDEVELQIDSTKELMDPLVFEVIGRGKILHLENIPPSKAKSQLIKLKLTGDMAPKVRVIVYYATSCGEVVADAVDFAVDGIFKTQVDLEARPNSTEPASPIEISVQTRPNAYVGLLAVDQSVLLLKSGNDITTRQVLDDLQGYEIGRQSYYSYNGGSYLMRPWRPPSPTTIQLFSHVGLIFFTNGLLAQIPTYGGYGGGGFHTAQRPMAEFAPQAFVGMAGAPGAPIPRPPPPPPQRNELMEPTRVRRYFPETFLWTSAMAGENGSVSIKADAPDTITSYVITAFAMDDENGLGLSKSPTKLQIFRPFFVTLNLPYSIVRGETLALQALVFNYLKDDIEAEVTLDNEGDSLEFIELENTVELKNPEQKHMTKTVKVKAGEGTSVTFLVSAKKLGHIDIKVTARSKVAADALVRKLLVKAEGTTVYFNKALLIDLRNQSNFEDKVTINIPKDFVPESERVEVSAISDIMGSTVNNIDKLLRMPYGCGEQNMLNFVPNIVITEYLTKTNQLTPEIKEKAIRFMESGYQRELTYKRYDGSFSAFGNSDKNGSTWLTAFVIKSFIQAQPYITVDGTVISSALNWLANLQHENGSFPEVGTVLHKAMQGGSGQGLGLTAYVLSAFIEGRKFDPKMERVDEVIKKSLALLEKELPNMQSEYDLVVTTYVLHLTGSSAKDAAFKKMQERAKKEAGLMYWSMPVPEVNASDPYAAYNRPKSVDVEMTAYGILTYVLRGQTVDAIPIMRWMVSKRNENGGFESTQDTVMGIQGLAKFAQLLSSPDGSNVHVTVTYPEDKKEIKLTKATALILHREQLPRTTRNVTVSATGNGIGIVQISWSYNVLSTGKNQAFSIENNSTGNNDELIVESCAKYTYEANGESNMAVMEISFPSGYKADRDYLPTIDETKKIKRVDTKDDDTKVVIYFDSIGNEVCTEARARREHKVAKVKPAMVEVYDYYDPMKRAEKFYDGPAMSVCELCESDECKKKEKCA